MYYEPATQAEYSTVSAFRLAYPDTSFGGMNSEPERNGFGLFTVDETLPSYDRDLQDCAPQGVELVNGVWKRVYLVTPKTLTEQQYMDIMVRRFDAALTAHLDTTAQTRRYDNRITCALRAGYAGPFQAEGAAFATWMDACNALGYQILAEVQAGARPAPASPEAFIAELPPMVWPA
jgi:hypothetical protein